MSVYDTIYDFYLGLFDNSALSSYQTTLLGVNTNLEQWLCIVLSIITLSLMVSFLIKCVVWLFKLFGGLFKW